MKKLIATLAFVLVSTNAHAIFLQSCYNHTFGDEAVSYSYQSCSNSNFREIERNIEEPMFLQHCSNFGDQVQYSYTSCMNRNFREIERKLEQPVFLSHCSNFRPDTLDFSFESCVRRNYSEIERKLRN
ncbi:MAG: hypothetical protein KC493_04155 [Bacteriovoracaceae bacterium]|nr:hypothetical protein [Bacteriovoracaceae bacterium]